MQLLPGFGGSPQLPPPPPPIPTREDPAIAAAREKERLAALRRSGRRATNITGLNDQLGSARVVQPELRGGAETLGA